MLDYCKKKINRVDAIIVWKLDRLSRFNTDYHGVIKPLVISNNISILSATESNINTIEGDFVRNIMMCNAEYELNLIRARTKANLKEKAEQGYFPAKAPLGYKNERGENKKGILTIDDKNAFFIKRAFDLYATGNYSYKKLSEVLFEDGFCTKAGKKHPPRKFEWMLKNIIYIGKFEWGKVVYEGKHAPIIQKPLFYHVQSMFPDTKDRKTHKEEFSYTGLIRCAFDGGYLTAKKQRGAHNSGTYIYYSCAKDSEGCRKKTRKPQAFFDRYFESLIGDLYVPHDIAVNIMKEAKKVYVEFEGHKHDTVEYMRSKIDLLSRRIEKSYIDKLDGRLPIGMNEDEFNNMQREWHAERDRYIEREREQFKGHVFTLGFAFEVLRELAFNLQKRNCEREKGTNKTNDTNPDI